MKNKSTNCPLDSTEIISQYFIENRSRLLDIAAFLDRLDRSEEAVKIREDFRLKAFYKAIAELLNESPYRVDRIHMALSDQSLEPLEKITETKSAWGAPQGQCC